jgi:hypothetical protein
LVDVFPREEAAKQDIARCKKEDKMYETAQQLVDVAGLREFLIEIFRKSKPI